jgi:hypothetical protein
VCTYWQLGKKNCRTEVKWEQIGERLNERMKEDGKQKEDAYM